MHTPTIFCTTCGRYLGAASSCIFCGWERPAALRVPVAGAPLWRLATTAPAEGRPLPVNAAVAGLPTGEAQLVILADRAGALTAVSAADGAILRQWAGGGPVRGALAAQGERAYAARRDGDLVALDLGRVTGGATPATFERWRFHIPAPGAPAADETRIYVGNGEGAVAALNDVGDRAEVAWRTPVGGRVSLAPVPWRRLLLVATSHAQGQLVALDASRGTIVWTQPLGARAAALLLPVSRKKGAGDQVITLTDRGQVRAFRLPDGEPLEWTHQVASGAVVTTIGDDGMVYLGDANGKVIALDPSTGAAREAADIDEAITGLAAWEGLLYVAARGGKLHLIDTIENVEQGCWNAGRPLTAGPAILDGAVLVGDETGWAALPWHLGQWRWAAARYRGRGNLDAAAACHALANEPEAAERTWLEANAPDRPAWLWTGLGQDQRAAAAFSKAADAVMGLQPSLAAAYLNRAADHLEACDEPAEAAAYRKLAGRLGRFPHLRLAVANLPAGEAGEPMTAAIEVRNLGNAPAERVYFRLGGRLARSVAGELIGPLAAGAGAVLEFEGLIPTASGRERLTVSVTCQGACSAAVRADASFEFDVAAPKPGAITIEGDAGAVILRTQEGAPPPRVRVKGMAGMVKIVEE